VHQAARYARWAAAAALLLVLIVAATYLHRAWRSAEEQRKAPPRVPPTVQQRSAEFRFSKVEKNRTLFTLRASHATEYKEANPSLLEDVWITIYGRNGERNDNIHTRECSYNQQSGGIVCHGEVQVDLQAAAGAAAAGPGQTVIHLDTSDVAFDRDSAVARTSALVRFSFPNGQGQAIGLTYHSGETDIELGRAVQFTLTGSGRSSSPSPPLFVTAGGFAYHRRDNIVILRSPVRARQGARELTAGYAEAIVDSALHPLRATISAQPEIVATEKSGRVAVRAAQFLASFSPASRLEHLVAEGQVRADRTNGLAKDTLEAEHAEMAFGEKNRLQAMLATGAVRAHSETPARSAQLDTAELRLAFSSSPKARGTGLSHAETPGPGTLVWKTPAEAMRVQAAQLSAEFAPDGQIREFHGAGGARIRRQAGSGLPTDSTSREFTMYFAGAQWSVIDQKGEVVLHQGVRTANAAQVRFLRADQTAQLSGNAAVAEPQSRTQADLILFDQARDELHARGNVRTSYSSSNGTNTVGLGQGTTYVVAPRLVAETKSGKALYSGGVRLWQGDAVLHADTVALNRQESELDARGNVTGTFLEAPGKSDNGKPKLWHVHAARLLDRSQENRAWLEGGATAVSANVQIAAPTIELIFERAQNGPSRLAGAVATGGVTLRQGDRWATGDRADYDAATNKVVMTGGPPALHDPAGNVVTGRQLTLFLASDTIQVVSDEGTRTLTKYRIAK